YIVAWAPPTAVRASEVMTTLDLARATAEVDQVRVVHRPRLLSDNGPCYVSQALGTYLTQHVAGWCSSARPSRRSSARRRWRWNVRARAIRRCARPALP